MLEFFEFQYIKKAGRLMKKKIIALTLVLAVAFTTLSIVSPEYEAWADSGVPNGLVWAVPPTLEYNAVRRCICGQFFATEGFDYPIDHVTGQILPPYAHGGHGGNPSNIFVYDIERNLFGEPGYYIGYHEAIGIHPFDQRMELFAWPLENQLMIVHSVDSTMRDYWYFETLNTDNVIVQEYQWFLSDEAFKGTLAVMYNGNFVTGFIFDDGLLGTYSWDGLDDGLAFNIVAMSINGRWGLVDRSGTTVAPFEFDSINLINNNIAVAVRNNMYGIINRTGDTLIPFVFDRILNIDGNTAFARYNGRYGILNISQTALMQHPANNTAPTDAEPGTTGGTINEMPDTTGQTPGGSPDAGNATESMQALLDSASVWARSYIERGVSMGIVPTAIQSQFTSNITRAEFAALAVSLYESARGGAITGRTTFSDTSDVNVQKAAYIGVVTGVGDDMFAPNAHLTREQAAVMVSRLANAIGSPLPQATAGFADNNEISAWAVSPVGQVQEAGIMSGVGGNAFNPQGTFTREQSIITILRLYDALS